MPTVILGSSWDDLGKSGKMRQHPGNPAKCGNIWQNPAPQKKSG
jgi:hypothetical protein